MREESGEVAHTLSAPVNEHRSILNKVLWNIEDLLELVRHLCCMCSVRSLFDLSYVLRKSFWVVVSRRSGQDERV